MNVFNRFENIAVLSENDMRALLKIAATLADALDDARFLNSRFMGLDKPYQYLVPDFESRAKAAHREWFTLMQKVDCKPFPASDEISVNIADVEKVLGPRPMPRTKTWWNFMRCK